MQKEPRLHAKYNNSDAPLNRLRLRSIVFEARGETFRRLPYLDRPITGGCDFLSKLFCTLAYFQNRRR